jgi:hypothetical protein
MQFVLAPQVGPVPHMQVALEQLSARLNEQLVHALPAVPHALVDVPALQRLIPWQQPLQFDGAQPASQTPPE